MSHETLEPTDEKKPKSDREFGREIGLRPELESTSEVDLEPLNGGMRTSNWRDRRETRARQMLPKLEDGAD